MISIFTPTHDSRFLPEIYESLKEQTVKDWEWVVLYNNGGEPVEFKDSRVKPHIAFKAPEWVGPLKAMACEKATGDILLELDHDDLLLPTALEEVERAFRNKEVGFVYSNSIHATGDLEKTPRYDERFGWKYREIEYKGRLLDEYISFDPTPNAVSKIWFAPDHLKAWRREVYEKVGGHDKAMRILDDADLMCRTYLETKFHHIDKPLYIYRIHGQNTWLKHNEEIQNNVYRLYDKYIDGLAEKWADDSKLLKIELGGRMFARKGFKTVDIKNADITTDLNKPWPFDDSSVGVIRALDIFEHLKDPLFTMQELYRVLVPGGYAFIHVPSTDGRGAFADPTHVSFWNERSFQYYTDQKVAQFIDSPVRFQATRLFTTEMNGDRVCWTIAHLIKLAGQRVPGEVLI